MIVVCAAVAAATPVLIQPEGLETRRADSPRFVEDPASAPGRCLVRVQIDENGLPYQAETRSCEPRYASLAGDTVLRWRWRPFVRDGAPVRVVTLVTFDFTPQGRVPVGPAGTCTYALRVAADGTVTSEDSAVDQCQLWAPAKVEGPVPAMGTCGVSVNPRIVRETPGWLDVGACPVDAAALAERLMAQALFSTGREATRLRIDLPDASTGPPPALAIDIPETADPGPARRLGGTTVTADDPMIEVSTVPFELPELPDLSALRAAPAPAPAPAPTPAPAPEDPTTGSEPKAD